MHRDATTEFRYQLAACENTTFAGLSIEGRELSERIWANPQLNLSSEGLRPPMGFDKMMYSPSARLLREDHFEPSRRSYRTGSLFLGKRTPWRRRAAMRGSNARSGFQGELPRGPVLQSALGSIHGEGNEVDLGTMMNFHKVFCNYLCSTIEAITTTPIDDPVYMIFAVGYVLSSLGPRPTTT